MAALRQQSEPSTFISAVFYHCNMAVMVCLHFGCLLTLKKEYIGFLYIVYWLSSGLKKKFKATLWVKHV